MRRSSGEFDFSDAGGRWIVVDSSGFSSLDPSLRNQRARGDEVRNRIAAWCRDPTILPDMLELYEELGGSHLRPPTSSDIEGTVIPFLRRAFTRGTAMALFARRGAELGKGAEKDDGVLGTKAPPPEPLPQDRPPARRAPRPVAAVNVLHNFAIRWVDEVGQGISGVPLELEHAGGLENESTDGSGVARIQDSPGIDATARIADVAALKSALKPKWDQIRNRPALTDADGVTVLALRGDLPTLDLKAETLRIVSVQPYVARARLLGGFFDTSKSFVLPSGLRGIREVARMAQDHPRYDVLIVGHTDKAGQPAYNDPLSVERAESLKAYLTDNVDEWLKFYGAGIAQEKRWGASEDAMMLGALPDASTRDPAEDPVRWFQRTRKLDVDGKAGPKTRGQLVKEYMALDGTSLPKDVEVTIHGCGENFPLKETPDGVAEQDNRRAEVFFFDKDLGVQPKPKGKNSKPGSPEYLEWERRVVKNVDIPLDLRKIVVQILDVEGEPLVAAPYEITVGGVVRKGSAGDRGVVFEEHLQPVERCELRWGYPPEPGKVDSDPPELQFERTLFLQFQDDAVDEAARRRLFNLGYDADDLQENVTAFQRDFDLPEAKWFDQRTSDELEKIHDEQQEPDGDEVVA